jgi:cytoskeletal protein CcmA (bactofilin family)
MRPYFSVRLKSGTELFSVHREGYTKVNGNLFSEGSVGIGTSAPEEKLEVSGNIKVSGNIVSDGDISVSGNIISDGDICIGNCD